MSRSARRRAAVAAHGAALTAVALLSLAPPAQAHRLSPAFLGLTETSPDVFSVHWKVSISGGLAAVLEPRLPPECVLTAPVRDYVDGDARLLIGEVDCAGGLAGRTIEIAGLAGTQTDALVRVDYRDGSAANARLTPIAPRTVIAAQPSIGEVVWTYTTLGSEHILLGVDHLLFVLALLLLVRGVGRLVATVTAFTVAHSLTLAAATLGVVRAPVAPVEAVIALSILLLAVELARDARARDAATAAPTLRAPPVSDLTARFPWIAAFAFGLLHGFGFAGALSEIGVPAHAVPLALLFFNVGVEAGQLLFIAAALACALGLRRFVAPPGRFRAALAYGIGAVAAFWVIERSVAVF